MVNGHHPVVDLAAHHPVADGGVDGIGKVDAGGTRGQVDDIALGGKGKDLLGQQVALQVMEQVAGVLADALVFQQLADPGQALVQLIVAVQPFLVLPVGGNAVLCLFIHLAGADLHLKGDALVADDGGVQALVAVGLRGGDIILEAVGQRVVHIVDEAQGAVALSQRIQNDTDGIDIVDLIEGLVLHDGLAVDAVDALDPALDGGTLDAALLQPQLDDTGHSGKELLPCTLAQHLADLLVAHGVKVVQAAVLQLLLDVQDAQTVGDGGIDLHRLTGLVAALLLRPGIAGAHIVEPVAELDDHHADIPAHGQQHLAQVLGLQLLDVGELDLGQLGHTVHQQGHFLAKGGGQVLQRGGGILHHVMEQGGGNALRIHAQIQHQAGHGQRVADVGLAAAAADPVVRLIGKVIGLGDHLHVVGLAAGLDGLAELLPGNDLRPHLAGQSTLGRIGRQGRSVHGRHLRHRLMQMRFCGVKILRRFLSLWHIFIPPDISGWGHRPGSSCLPWEPAPRTLPRRAPRRRSAPPVPGPSGPPAFCRCAPPPALQTGAAYPRRASAGPAVPGKR